MDNEDLQTFAQIGKSFWTDAELTRRSTAEILSAVSLLELPPERAIERACSALLDCVNQKGESFNSEINIESLGHRFFRISVERRFVLVALHLGRWSYGRIGRILQKPTGEIEEIAWSSRLEVSQPSVYPAGPHSLGPECPEYDSRAPWMQRFLDEEVETQRERIFLQEHLLKCDGCSKAMTRTKDFYFRIGREVSDVVGDSDLVAYYQEVLKQNPNRRFPGEKTLWEVTAPFLKRKDIVLAIGVLAVLVFAMFFRSLH